ncbi:hemicentin-1-like [Saccostrea cucullata]|uniref:hemicentin-1-like n=1 Tax=Saccostrea cuccullata TaxID=36930 RepID=UPI002ED4772F
MRNCLRQCVLVTVLLTFPALAAPQDDVPPGAATLAFVFDITGSMYDDLVQVIDGAAKIMATTLARRDKPLYNYVLVPFHDPDVGPIVITKDPDEFQSELRNLYVQGGGDCPEMSVRAIKEALDVSLPNSYIYVFTDALSKDFYLGEEVLALIQQKQSQVVFVLTGDCGNPLSPGYKVYERIASTSSGQVFLLKKDQVNQVLEVVRLTVKARKVNLMSVDQERANSQFIQIPIDSRLQEFTVSLSGSNPKLRLYNPKGIQTPKLKLYNPKGKSSLCLLVAQTQNSDSTTLKVITLNRKFIVSLSGSNPKLRLYNPKGNQTPKLKVYNPKGKSSLCLSGLKPKTQTLQP